MLTYAAWIVSSKSSTQQKINSQLASQKHYPRPGNAERQSYSSRLRVKQFSMHWIYLKGQTQPMMTSAGNFHAVYLHSREVAAVT